VNQVRPQTNIPVVRQLDDPADSSTLYVRAFVYNSLTNALITSFNLEDQGSHRFSAKYNTPADYSGTGYFIDITTKVYSDAGYTTQDTIYANENQEYHVMEMWNQSFGSGGGGSDIDYKRIREIIKGEVDKLPPPKVSINLDPILLELQGVRKAIGQIESPKTDLSPVIYSIDGLMRRIEKVDTKTDLSHILRKLESISTKIVPEVREKKEDKETPVMNGMLEKILNFVTPKPKVVPVVPTEVKVDRSVEIKERANRLIGKAGLKNLERAKRLMI